MTEMTLSELAARLGGRLCANGDRLVRGVCSLETAGADEVAFLANVRYERHMAETKAAAVIVAADYAGPGEALIRCEDPYFAFREAMVIFYGFRNHGFDGLDDRAAVHPTACVAEGARLAPFVVVSAGASIASGSTLYPGVYVGPGCRIGTDCVLHPNVALYEGCLLGDRVTIHAGSSIGQDGFGYAPHTGADGVVRHEKIPQAGWVVIEDDVEIGACCTIDRATMGSTTIGAGTKFSNLVAIGHGTQMGKHCLLVAQAGIAGSVRVGDHCVFAGQCGVVGHIRIGSGARVGAQAGVTGDVAPGVTVMGSPALPRSLGQRAMSSFAHLPELRRTVRRLTRKLEELKRRLAAGEQQARD